MSIKSRMPKINKIAQTAREIYNSGKGKIVYRVDSLRTGRPFQVITEVYRNGILQAKVQMYTFDHKEQVNDKGNHPADFYFNNMICYQALGSLKARAKATGKILSLCDDYKSAKKLLNFGGELIKIHNFNGVVWGTLR